MRGTDGRTAQRVATLTRSHPALDLFIVPGTPSELCEQLLGRTIDTAVVVEPPLPPRKGRLRENGATVA